jgi:choice-of-anchor B domain-containing protein
MTRGTLARAGLAGAAATIAGFVLTAGAHDEDWRKMRDLMPAYVGPIVTLHSPGAVDAEFDSLNMTLLSWIPLSEFPGGHNAGNDVWGYTSPSGREYAIMGLQKGYGFVEITDPTNPVLLDVVTGPSSTWHDLKVIGQYAYGVSEAGSGIQVIDLARIDEGIVRWVQNKTQLGHSSSHNIVSNEESGFLYVVGGNVASGGLWAVDTVDPENPTYAGAWSEFYVHDAQVVTYTDGPYAGREIAFAFGGRSGGWSNTGLRIVDVTDKSNMFTISDAFWSEAGYAHQGWLSEDRKYLYVDDELDEEMGLVPTTTTRIFDVSDLSNPAYVGSFTTGLPSTDHNQYVKGDRLYQANYRTGVRVWDISNPVDPEEIAWIDTHPEGDQSGYTGVWSVFPYFDSGTIIASDMVRGLFVLRVESDTTCRADLDGDGELTFFDFLAFQNLFSAGDPQADFTGDGVLDFFDFLAFQDEFSAGCP